MLGQQLQGLFEENLENAEYKMQNIKGYLLFCIRFSIFLHSL